MRRSISRLASLVTGTSHRVPIKITTPMRWTRGTVTTVNDDGTATVQLDGSGVDVPADVIGAAPSNGDVIEAMTVGSRTLVFGPSNAGTQSAGTQTIDITFEVIDNWLPTADVCTLTEGSAVIALDDTTGLTVGATVAGTGVGPFTVTAIDADVSFTVDSTSMVSVTGLQLSYTDATSPLTVPMTVIEGPSADGAVIAVASGGLPFASEYCAYLGTIDDDGNATNGLLVAPDGTLLSVVGGSVDESTTQQIVPGCVAWNFVYGAVELTSSPVDGSMCLAAAAGSLWIVSAHPPSYLGGDGDTLIATADGTLWTRQSGSWSEIGGGSGTVDSVVADGAGNAAAWLGDTGGGAPAVDGSNPGDICADGAAGVMYMWSGSAWLKSATFT